jgi:hypothetical protein
MPGANSQGLGRTTMTVGQPVEEVFFLTDEDKSPSADS